MKKFKFFKGIVPDEITPYNGVTDSYLIELNRDIHSYSDWIYSSNLAIDQLTGLDSIIIEFKDIDNYYYWCKILSDGSIQIFMEITDDDGEFQMLEPVFTSPDRVLNTNNFINYLKNMPKTLISSI